jgi:hypothetical protein
MRKGGGSVGSACEGLDAEVTKLCDFVSLLDGLIEKSLAVVVVDTK